MGASVASSVPESCATAVSCPSSPAYNGSLLEARQDSMALGSLSQDRGKQCSHGVAGLGEGVSGGSVLGQREWHQWE